LKVGAVAWKTPLIRHLRGTLLLLLPLPLLQLLLLLLLLLL
jgi:hypothetical protein